MGADALLRQCRAEEGSTRYADWVACRAFRRRRCSPVCCEFEAEGRLRWPLTASGQVRYALKTPYRDGTTHIVLEPLDLMARLAALPSPPAGEGGK